MNARNSRVCGGAPVVSLLLVVVAGCGLVEPPPPPAHVPALMRYVVEHKDLFKSADNGPLANAATDTVIDSLDGLDGCWGAYEVSPSDPTNPFAGLIGQSTGDSNVRTYYARHFERATGSVTEYVLQDYFGFATVLVGSRGPFQVNETNKASYEFMESYNPDTDAFDTLEVPYESEEYLTRAGDSFRARYLGPEPSSSDDPLGEDPFGMGDVIYYRFACPPETD